MQNQQEQLTPEQQAALDKYEIKPLTPEQQAALDKYEIKTPQSSGPPSSLENFLAGMGNAIVNTGNAVPETLNWIAHKAGYGGKGLVEAPQIQGNYDPHTLSYLGGNIASNIPLSIGGGKILSSAKYLREAPEFVKAVLLGSGLGAATNPEGERLEGTAEGAAGGAVGNIAGKAVRGAIQTPFMNAVTNRGRDLLAKNFGKIRGGSGQLLANQIAKVKKALDINNTTNYQTVWHKLSNQAGVLPGMTEEDFPEYTKQFNALQKGSLPPFISKVEDIQKTAAALKSDPTMQAVHEAFGNQWPVEAAKINPQDVHFYKSALSKLSGGKNKTPTEHIYGVLKNALENDFSNFLGKQDKEAQGAYKYAQSYYKNNYLPFVNHPAALKVSQQFNYKNLGNVDKDTLNHVLTTSDWQGSTPSKLLQYITPSKDDEDMAKFYGLGRVTSGEPTNIKQKWLDFARNRYLNQKTTNVGTTPVANTNNMLSNYEALTPEQKEMWFNPGERTTLDHLVQQAKKYPENLTTRKWLSNAAKRAVGGAVGAAVGTHLPFNYSTLAAGLGGAALAPSLMEALSGSIEKRLPASLEKLAPIISNEDFLKPVEKYMGRAGAVLGATPLGKAPLLLLNYL